MAAIGATVATNTGTATNANNAYVTFLTTTPTLLAGTYLVHMNCGVSSGTAARYSEVALVIDGAIISNSVVFHNVANNTTYSTSFESAVLTAAAHTFQIQFRRSAASGLAATITASDGTLVIYKVL